MNTEPGGNKVGFFSSCTTQSVAILGAITALLTALTAWVALSGQLSSSSGNNEQTQPRSQMVIEQPTEAIRVEAPTEVIRVEAPTKRDDPHLRSGTYDVTTIMTSNTCRPETIGDRYQWKFTFEDVIDNDGKIFPGDAVGIAIDDELGDTYSLALPVTSIYVQGFDFEASIDIAITGPTSIELAIYAVDAYGCEAVHQGST
jgi:hypothetical protein